MPQLRIWLLAVAGVMFAILVIIYAAGWFSSDGAGDPAALAETALNASDRSEAIGAAIQLARTGENGLDQMRRVFRESKDPNVRAAMASALGRMRDRQSVPALLAAMDDDSSLVRSQAALAVEMILGRSYDFRADAPPQDRQQVIDQMRQDYENAGQPVS